VRRTPAKRSGQPATDKGNNVGRAAPRVVKDRLTGAKDSIRVIPPLRVFNQKCEN
jgi:hypothetical protein